MIFMKNHDKGYESPKSFVVTIDVEDILCASTEEITETDGDWGGPVE